MTREKKRAIACIDEKKELICTLADQIWQYAELSLQEEKSAELYCQILEREGFSVEKGICGIPTAFYASFGTGKPVIGLLAEYDALSGLSQKGGAVRQEALPGTDAGHGCGHNLLGAGALAAALGVQRWLAETGHGGTVILYGCPGEEGGAAKAFMAREGLWKKLDAALTWHPEDCNEVVVGSCSATLQVQYAFSGVASHAAGAPELGRSALDAVELMNVGVQFLREHMPTTARIHYAITNAGGRSANVVQPRATVLYMVRGKRVSEAQQLLRRVDQIAEGAALMTETSFTRTFIDGTADLVPNHTLEKTLYQSFAELGVPSYTEDELNFAAELQQTYRGSDKVPGLGSASDAAYAGSVQSLCRKRGAAMNDFLLPYYEGEAYNPGSTDVGDVSWQTPAAQCHVAAWPNGCPGHSWQNVSCAATSIGQKAAIHAGKVLCSAAIELLSDQALLQQARTEFETRTAESYTCPIPPDAVPAVPD